MLPDSQLLAPQDIAVIGAGYVGLTAATCFAKLGHNVTCTDASLGRLERISRGDAPIVEVGLSELVREMQLIGRLRFSISNTRAVSRVSTVFLCLPTPPGEGGRADLSYVCSAAEEIGPHLVPGTVVVNKSTVPVGTAQLVQDALMRPDVHVVSNPEFLAEGTAVRDFLHPDRIVIGSASSAAAEKVAALYGDIQDRVLYTDWASAELIKYASNAYLATRLTFVNSLASICEAVGADIRFVTSGIGTDSRIGPSFLNPGPGWGGSRFPKDTSALARTAAAVGLPSRSWKPRSPSTRRILPIGGEGGPRGRRRPARSSGGNVGPHFQGQHRRHALRPASDLARSTGASRDSRLRPDCHRAAD